MQSRAPPTPRVSPRAQMSFSTLLLAGQRGPAMQQFLISPIQFSAIRVVHLVCLRCPEGGEPSQGLRGDQGELLEAHEGYVLSRSLTQDARGVFPEHSKGIGKTSPLLPAPGQPPNSSLPLILQYLAVGDLSLTLI